MKRFYINNRKTSTPFRLLGDAMRLPNNPKPDGKVFRQKFGADMLNETLNVMKDLFHKDRRNPYVKRVANLIVSRCPRGAEHPEKKRCQINKIFFYVQRGINNDVSKSVHYVNDPLDQEWITYPSVLLSRMTKGTAFGDCDDQALLIATLLSCNGILPRFRVISTKVNGDYHHIYTVAYNDQTREWIPVDTIYDDFVPGSEVKYAKKKDIDLGIMEAV